ncbi:SDR family oxidoreductase [Pseudoduganella umbonata]|uniref:NAD(P)-dependent dehydrogenase (Short-subunit alcohol dehydrogenase family) n=1 Tax=Pseudoduganella umbonata TaxID=864828 RepID=A0A4P8HYI7_9BURK|nr:SDR family oxidoreductase [Pseudoduganella umbonata]MBB3224095.1 NAD(P)-dependent dehydrogenase (short-subunit alcohol dehydrogenase family) [Pseudoduganella umbonata]QCP14038.1 SDR family NAD(P)-dependent oxidoreductase [Pseudoduganella umbonata]
MTNWTSSNIPLQPGRTAVVTGTGGLGFEDAYALAAAGASVIIAGRNPERGRAAVQRIRHDLPHANVRFEELDLASLVSVQAFADRLYSLADSIDVLINNAAVMTPPRRQITQDGFELQLGTNHLGHFALTAALLPLLRRSDKARVVSLSSIAARNGALNFQDLQSENAYQPMAAYAQSKLACLMFALELQRRSDSEGWGISSIAAHPGIARTDLLPNGAGPRSGAGLARRFLWFLFQPAAQGALPTLFAATAPEAEGGGYYGPNQLGESRGYPGPARLPAQALERDAAALLWTESERLTGARYGLQDARASVQVW